MAILRALGRGDPSVALINALRVEPELGPPARDGLPATTAHRVPGGWSLTGRKIFSTGAAAALRYLRRRYLRFHSSASSR